MKVKALKGFMHVFPEGDPRIWIMVQPGQVLDMPEGADWVVHGLAVPVVEMGAPEKEVIKAPEKRGRKKKNDH